ASRRHTGVTAARTRLGGAANPRPQLGHQRDGVRAAQLARRRLRDRAGAEHDDVARAQVDLRDHLMGDLVRDPAYLSRILPGVGLDGDGERLPGMAGVETHRDGAPGANPVDAAGGALDVGRVDVAAGHDDDVLDPAADYDVAVLHQVAEVAGVVPAAVILCRDEAAHRDVARGQRLAPQLDDAHTAGRHHVAVLVDDPGFQVLQQRTQRGQPA